MKKFLAILLIAIVACETVQDLDLEGWWGKVKDWCKKVWHKLSDAVKHAVNWLKENGYYDLLKGKILEIGKAAATAFCSTYLGPEFCANAVEGVSKLAGI